VVGAVLAPAAFVALWFAPLPLPGPAHRLSAVFGAVLIAWVTEVLPVSVTALLVAPLLVATGVREPKVAFASYADPLLFLFIGGFFIARAMSRHGLDARLASWLVASRGVGGRRARVRIALGAAAFALSMWVSNTATTAILVPILLGLRPRRRDKTHLDARNAGADDTSFAPGAPRRGRRAECGDLLVSAYLSSVGGLATPVGSPPNLVAMRLLESAGETLGFLGWMGLALPIALACAALVTLWVGRALPADGGRVDVEAARRRARAPASRGEWVTLACFALAVAGWVAPGLAQAVGRPLPQLVGTAVARLLEPGIVALLAAAPLFAVPVGPALSGDRVLPWRDAVRIDWGVVLLFGGGIALGDAMDATGLSAALGHGLVHASGVSGPWSLTAVLTVVTLLLTEVASNVATATMLVPLASAMARELGVSPVAPVVGVGLAASCAFMLPIATGPNAVIHGTGRVPARTMMGIGAVANLLCAGTILLGLWLLVPRLER
jgi:sodium-dependent dicarboxylate transporter 2/3/5